MNYRNENQAQGYEPTFTWEQLQAAVLAEREACAKVCDHFATGGAGSEYDIGYIGSATSCAAAIRARGEK